MGVLVYGHGTEYEIDDRTLAHLKFAISAKLRRQESFLLSWVVEPELVSGRVSLWLSPNIPVQFRFYGSRPPQLNRGWLEVLSELSHSSRGLIVVSEADADEVKAGTKSVSELEA